MFSVQISILVSHSSIIRPSVPKHDVSNTDAYLTFEPSELLLFYYWESLFVGRFTLATELTVISVNSYLHEIPPDRGEGREEMDVKRCWRIYVSVNWRIQVTSNCNSGFIQDVIKAVLEQICAGQLNI